LNKQGYIFGMRRAFIPLFEASIKMEDGGIMKNSLIAFAALVATFVGGAQVASATLLPGSCQNVSPSIFCPGSIPTLTVSGSQVATTGPQAVKGTNVTGTVVFTGSFISAVYRNTGGTLDFYYQFSDASTSTDAIQHLSVGNFSSQASLVNIGVVGSTPFSSAANGSFSNGTYSPGQITWAANGSTIDFANWFTLPFTSFGVAPGATAMTVVVQTNATTWTSGTAQLINNGTWNGSAFEPSNVPEPAGIVLFGTASALTAFFFRRRLTGKA
jgi:hypothetical protein